ncbi:MAG: UvrD-helicase domain-containing protein [Bacteroidales bacterium]
MAFLVYRSSAGSGKTFTLVKTFLEQILESPERFNQVLAITFTNKAAGEMKERVLQTLTAVASADTPDDIEGPAGKIFGLIASNSSLPPETLQQNARKALKYILHRYSELAIGTIDSFMHRIVRTFSFDLRLPESFDVETDSTKILSYGVHALTSLAGIDKEATRLLIKFVENQIEDEKSWRVEKPITDIGKLINNEVSRQKLPLLADLKENDFLEIHQKLQKRISVFEKEVLRLATEAWEIIESNNIDSSTFFQGARGIYGWLKSLAAGDFSKLQPNSYVRQTLEEGRWTSKSGSKGSQLNRNDTLIQELDPKCQALYQYITEQIPHYKAAGLIRNHIFPLGVLNRLNQIIEDYKRREEVVLVSDFNHLVAGQAMEQQAPYIYFRVGDRYHHFLIDEFQDTSYLQWQNLLPLIEEALAKGGTGMVVGDAKQAIYRWRNGEVDQFVSLPRIYNNPDSPIHLQREKTLIDNYSPKVLNSNYRSAHEIVHFNNRLFKHCAGLLPDIYKKVYQDAGQVAASSNRSGYVSILFRDSNADKDFDIQKTLEIIRKCLDDGYGYDDLAVLVRQKKDGQAVALRLIEEGIPVVSADSLSIETSAEVNAIISVLRLLVNHKDEIAATTLIEWLCSNGRIDLQLKEAIANWKETVKNQGKRNGSRANTFDWLRKQGIHADPSSLSYQHGEMLIHEIVKLLGLSAAGNIFLQIFFDEVRELGKKEETGASEIVTWWNESAEDVSVVTPEELNAVRVLTIHKAKGLEFPVVITPFANPRFRSGKNLLWVPADDYGLPSALVEAVKPESPTPWTDQMEEEYNKMVLDYINLMYVALTRPSERLYIITSIPPKKKSETPGWSVYLSSWLKAEGLWEEGRFHYEFGTESPKTKRENPDSWVPPEPPAPHPDWTESLKVRWQHEKAFAEHENERAFGIAVHDILSRIHTPDDLDQALEASAAEGFLPAGASADIKEKLKNLLSHPSVEPFFRSGNKTLEEPSILLPDGNIIRPDKIILYETETCVLEFKTGEKSDHHPEQVRGYLEALDRAGYPGLKGYIIYLHSPEPEVVCIGL